MADETLRVCVHCGKTRPRSTRTQFCSTECRFWHKVHKAGPDECWIWQGTTPSFGHGQFVCEGRVVYAHRFAWEMANGPLPDDGSSCVLHRCDVPACVNPAHLFVGTRGDNMADMWAKRRGSPPPRRRGSQNAIAVLTERQVAEIRASPLSDSAAARAFGVARRTINNIRNRRTWTHVA